MNSETITRNIMEKVEAWKQSQEGQLSGYEYERSFLEMMNQVRNEVFQASMGDLPPNVNKKK
jgi:hypothetical protein